MSQVEWIRYHSSMPTECRAYRIALKENKVATHVIPEECMYCSTFLLTSPRYTLPYTAILQYLRFSSHEMLLQKFRPWFLENREQLFEFIATALNILFEDSQTCFKILNAVIDSAGKSKKRWVLEGIALRPYTLHSILNSTPTLPFHMSYNFWGVMDSFEEYWPFWESMLPAAKRKIRFRTLRYKEELMAKAWHPSRFLEWCSDNEERQEMKEMWGLHI